MDSNVAAQEARKQAFDDCIMAVSWRMKEATTLMGFSKAEVQTDARKAGIEEAEDVLLRMVEEREPTELKSGEQRAACHVLRVAAMKVAELLKDRQPKHGAKTS